MVGYSQSFFPGPKGVIVYLVTADHAYTLNRYLQEWAPELTRFFQPIFYEENPWDWLDREATYVFSDIERLTPIELQKVIAYADELGSKGFRVLNHPSHAPTRLAVQTILHQAGINPFNMFPVTEAKLLKFPVFLRLANSHQGSIGDLIHSQAELESRLAALDKKTARAKDLVVVEYCNTQNDQGRFTKYSAMCVGNKLVPRHALSSRQWMLKVPDIVDDEAVQLENDFLQNFPQQEEIRRIFSLAKIDFGRIDFGLQNNAIRVWEINTNPTFMPLKKGLHPARAEMIHRSNIALIDALKALNTETQDVSGWTEIANRHKRMKQNWWWQRKLFRRKRA